MPSNGLFVCSHAQQLLFLAHWTEVQYSEYNPMDQTDCQLKRAIIIQKWLVCFFIYSCDCCRFWIEQVILFSVENLNHYHCWHSTLPIIVKVVILVVICCWIRFNNFVIYFVKIVRSKHLFAKRELHNQKLYHSIDYWKFSVLFFLQSILIKNQKRTIKAVTKNLLNFF